MKKFNKKNEDPNIIYQNKFDLNLDSNNKLENIDKKNYKNFKSFFK